MPTYEYRCKSCGEHLEVVQSFKDEPLTTCPGCGGDLRKVFGSIGIAFKGSGFYKTDSRAAASGSKSSKSESAGGDSGKADSAAAGSSGSGSSGSSSGSGGSSSGSSSSSGSGTGSSGSGSTAAAAS
jgi:putative FmdB family regulatory protein